MPSADIPAPISWSPSQYWDGADGNWSSFDLRVGTPEQLVRVLPSTAASATWVVIPSGCEHAPSVCSDARGGLFNFNDSSSWDNLGLYTLVVEQNIAANQSGIYGTDTLSLGLNNAVGTPADVMYSNASGGNGGVTLPNQIFAGVKDYYYFNGIFGLSRQPMYLGNLTTPRDSFLTSLRKADLIPSLSWAYTAGARYRSTGVFGSLTLGGSDLSRYTPNDVSFHLAGDSMRDLVVGLQSITSVFANGSSSTLLSSPVLTFIDSTIPFIYLPPSACEMFESNLGLKYNETMNMYLIDDALHQELLLLNPQFTFKIGSDLLSTPTVDITLPYAAFDLLVGPPLLPRNNSYFPIRRAASNGQLTLGRVFLQEAYLITNYDNNNFTVAQALFNSTGPPAIIPIPWNATTKHHVENHLSRGSIAGISIGAVLFVVLIALSAAFYALRRRSRKTKTQTRDYKQGNPSGFSELRAPSFVSVKEIGQSSIREDYDHPHELHNTFQVELLDEMSPSGSGKEVKELSDHSHPNGSGNILYELPDENSPSTSATATEELSETTRPSSCTETECRPSSNKDISRSDCDRQSPGPRKKPPDDGTGQFTVPPNSKTHSRSNAGLGTIFDPRRRVTKGRRSTITGSSTNSFNSNRFFRIHPTRESRDSKKFPTQASLSPDRDKELPPIPPEMVKTARRISFHPVSCASTSI